MIESCKIGGKLYSNYLDKHYLNLNSKKLVLKNLDKERLIIFHKQDRLIFISLKLYYNLFLWPET